MNLHLHFYLYIWDTWHEKKSTGEWEKLISVSPRLGWLESCLRTEDGNPYSSDVWGESMLKYTEFQSCSSGKVGKYVSNWFCVRNRDDLLNTCQVIDNINDINHLAGICNWMGIVPRITFPIKTNSYKNNLTITILSASGKHDACDDHAPTFCRPSACGDAWRGKL